MQFTTTTRRETDDVLYIDACTTHQLGDGVVEDSRSGIHVGLHRVLCERGGTSAVGFGESLT